MEFDEESEHHEQTESISSEDNLPKDITNIKGHVVLSEDSEQPIHSSEEK